MIEREHVGWAILKELWGSPGTFQLERGPAPVIFPNEDPVAPCFGLCASVKTLQGIVSEKVQESMSRRLEAFLATKKWNHGYLWDLDKVGANCRYAACKMFEEESKLEMLGHLTPEHGESE